MLEPNSATAILLIACVLLLVVVPIMDGSKRFGKYISLRYTLVAVALIMSLGCILDFSHLADHSRDIVLLGGLILVGIFIILRSCEKMKLGGKTIELSAGKGDAKITATITGEKSPLIKKNGESEPDKQMDAEDLRSE
jgi:hypothetical protein